MTDDSRSQIPVIIASLLKPSHDSRAWSKLGISLRETSQYTLNIIGFSPKKIEKTPDAIFYSSGASGRSGWDRIKAVVNFTRILLKVRPKLLICCTYEYLPVARLFKNIIGYRLVYDVQENYAANLQLNPTLTEVKKKLMSKLIRLMENPKGIDLFLLAESCYQSEMPEKTPFLILENKFEGKNNWSGPKNYRDKSQFNFLITGTLSPMYGTLEAIIWFKKILRFYPQCTLEIRGHVTLNFYQKELEKAAENEPSILLKISKNPIPHEALIQANQKADFLLLPYQPHPAIWNKMPTKLYESAAMSVPVLISPNPIWQTFLDNHNAGSTVNFSGSTSVEEEFQRAILQSYFQQSPDQSLLWDNQKLAFTSAIASFLTD